MLDDTTSYVVAIIVLTNYNFLKSESKFVPILAVFLLVDLDCSLITMTYNFDLYVSCSPDARPSSNALRCIFASVGYENNHCASHPMKALAVGKCLADAFACVLVCTWRRLSQRIKDDDIGPTPCFNRSCQGLIILLE
ncbi:hypothetical protein AM586_25095 [Massilia sp. WG5]|nr:hypothetical protein AM586_25095 [Massilia sp. WG5]